MSSTDNIELQDKIEEWMKYDFNELTRQTVIDLVSKNDVDTLKDMMMKPLVFGTAGIRAKMGAGFSYLNDVTIIQTCQGLLRYLQDCQETKYIIKEKGVVIGFDGRYHSHRWAKMCANIFLQDNIKVFLFSRLVPTPFVPYAIKQLECVAGIMITASHNPREYNGLKLYWTNGVQDQLEVFKDQLELLKDQLEMFKDQLELFKDQLELFKDQLEVFKYTLEVQMLISPHDKHIATQISLNQEPWPKSWIDLDVAKYEKEKMLVDPITQITQAYLKFLDERLIFKDLNQQANIPISFTALHGMGWVYAQQAFKVGKFESVFSTTRQQDPDPNFPTLDFPNPEEGKFVFKLAMETAYKHNCTLVLATDPDADRMASVELQKGDKWHFFNGNEQGTLFGWWCFFTYLYKNGVMDENGNVTNAEKAKELLSKVYMVASTVSAHMLKRMAQIEGFNFAETLTGFKWIGNKVDELIKAGNTVLFAYEEAIGYMCDPRILDKDGISASLLLAEMASFYKVKKGITLYEKLHEIYEKYGFNVCANSYLNCYDPNVIVTIFDNIRNWEGKPNNYPTHCGDYKIKYIRDLTTGYDNSQPDNKAILPYSKSNQMITFTFDLMDISITLRASGTEPKIKYYSELIGPAGSKTTDCDALKKQLNSIVDGVVNSFLKPGVNNISYPERLPDSDDMILKDA